MAWNWTQPHWPHLTYDPAALEPLERHFLLLSGEVIGAVRHVGDDDRDLLRIIHPPRPAPAREPKPLDTGGWTPAQIWADDWADDPKDGVQQ